MFDTNHLEEDKNDKKFIKKINSLEENAAKREIRNISIETIEANEFQPRKDFVQELLDGLAQSISQNGLLQPILVRENKSGFQLIAGERRLRACKKLGWKNIPALVVRMSDEESLKSALVENIQRADLNPIEEAKAYESLIQHCNLTQEQCAEHVGKDRATVTNMLRILTLPIKVQEDIKNALLTIGHAKALLSLEDPDKIQEAREMILKKMLSVRQTEQLCKEWKKNNRVGELALLGQEQEEEVDANLVYLADMLRTHLRTKIRFSGTAQRGKMEISFFSAAELERILDTVLGRK